MAQIYERAHPNKSGTSSSNVLCIKMQGDFL